MPFVLDASVAHAWLLDERHPTADAIRQRLVADQAVTPTLWWFELRNGLVMGERRRRITEKDTERLLSELAAVAIEFDSLPAHEEVLALARRQQLSVYDAAYLELALRRRLPLATLDRALASAARSEGVAVLE